MKLGPTGQIAPWDAHQFQPGTRSGGPRCPPNTPVDGDSSRSWRCLSGKGARTSAAWGGGG